jgi:integrase
MPKIRRVPSYRFHKGSGQAVVVLAGKSVYLGKWNTPNSRAEYERVLSEWLALRQRPKPSPNISRGADASALLRGPTVGEVILAFWQYAQKHYRYPDGRPTRELDNLRDALRPVRQLYSHTPARDFGPLALRAIQEQMIKDGLCRTVINDRIKRVRRAVRWAASVELIPASVVQGLETVPPLRRGRCDARESAGVQPVSWETVEATLPHLPGAVAAMVQVMRYSNCRAEDVVSLRGRDLTTEGKVWEYRPVSHKNAWREEDSLIHQRIVYLGPRCQEIIGPFLKSDLDAYLFSPRESRQAYQTQRALQRRTKRTPSELRRRRKSNPRRAAGACYSVNSLQQAVRKACRKLGVPVWTVLQVRHTRATEVREAYGVEGAQASLGHSRVETAQIYAERNQQLARRIAREIG